MTFGPLNRTDSGQEHASGTPRRHWRASSLAREVRGEGNRSVLQHQPGRGGTRNILQQLCFKLDDHTVISPPQEDLLRSSLFRRRQSPGTRPTKRGLLQARREVAKRREAEHFDRIACVKLVGLL